MSDRLDEQLMATTEEILGTAGDAVAKLRDHGDRADDLRTRQYVTGDDRRAFAAGYLSELAADLNEVKRRHDSLVAERTELLPKVLGHTASLPLADEVLVNSRWPLVVDQVASRIERGQSSHDAVMETLNFAHQRGDSLAIEAAHRNLAAWLDARGHDPLESPTELWLAGRSRSEIARNGALDEINNSGNLYRAGMVVGLATGAARQPGNGFNPPTTLIDPRAPDTAIELDATADSLTWLAHTAAPEMFTVA